MIVGLDVGNLTTVCVSEDKEIVFESRLKEYQDINSFGGKDVFEIDNKKLIFEEGHFENNLLKYKKDNFISLVYYAIAKATDCSKIKLAIGVPAGQFNKEKENIRRAIMQNSRKTIKLNQEIRTITIEETFVIPEAYGIKAECEVVNTKNNAKTLVIDVGGGTTDVAEFDEKGRFIGGKSIKSGLISLYKEVAELLDNEYQLSVSLEDARKYYDGELSVKDDRFQDVNDYKKQATLNLGKHLLNELRGMYENLTQYNIILTGGGAKRLYPLFVRVYPQTKIVDKIQANARGFRKVGVAKWQKN